MLRLKVYLSIVHFKSWTPCWIWSEFKPFWVLDINSEGFYKKGKILIIKFHSRFVL
jgi:hypothetical protein